MDIPHCGACHHINSGHDLEDFSLDGSPVSCFCGCPEFVEEEDGKKI